MHKGKVDEWKDGSLYRIADWLDCWTSRRLDAEDNKYQWVRTYRNSHQFKFQGMAKKQENITMCLGAPLTTSAGWSGPELAMHSPLHLLYFCNLHVSSPCINNVRALLRRSKHGKLMRYDCYNLLKKLHLSLNQN